MKAAVALGILVACSVLSPLGAAHANFVESHPAPGARLAASPPEVRVTVSQDVDPAGSSVVVRDAQGTRVDRDDLRVEPGQRPSLVVGLKENLTEGVYRVEWKALSRVDHHTTREAFAFSVGNFTAPDTASPGSNAPNPAAAIGRAVFFLGLFLAAGALLFTEVVARNRVLSLPGRAERLGWVLVAAGSIFLLADAFVRTGIAPRHVVASPVLSELLARTLISGLVLGVVLLVRRAHPARTLVVAAGIAMVAFFSARSGHASPAGAFVTGVDAAHLLATASWVGGLAIFAYLLFDARRLGLQALDLRQVGVRFGRAALVCVIVMVVTGVTVGVAILGWPRMSQPAAWFEGAYGAALLGKILLAVGMVVVAGLNRFIFLARLGADDAVASGGERRRFGRFVAAETAMGVCALVLAAVMTAASPPFEATPEPFVVQGQGEEFHVRMQAVRPPMPGAYSDLMFRITWDQDGSVLQNDTCGRTRGCIQLEVAPPGAQDHDADPDDVHRGGEHRVLEPLGDGYWIVRDVLFVESGEYELLVEIQTEYVFLDVVELHVVVEHPAGHEDAHAQHA